MCQQIVTVEKFDCYILQTALLAIILPLKSTINCYHYAKHWSKQKELMH